ncbi:MAG TPA: winged helix-turn-helix domain-containing protein [Solirubrobacteraceae bacterium]|nr:winged helix-turn-helix domain-containing protein [Solirubrobacteraceae bacterium]
MQPTISIEIDADIYNYLKERSTFEDSVSSVLRREMGLSEPKQSQEQVDAAKDLAPPRRGRPRARSGTSTSGQPRRAAAGTLLPESEYHRPILEAIAEAGGTAPKQVVIDAVGERLGERLTDVDREELNSGGIRWQSRIQFARLRLIDRGLIKKNAPRGTWAITTEGSKALEEERI